MAAFADARAGRGGLVLISGDPGIGKTRLARTLGDQARDAGAQVALARGWDGGGAPAYWPWLQVLRALAAERDDDALAAQLGPGARWVAQIAPEIRARLGIAEAGDAAESEQARFALFDAVSVFMRRAAADAPVVVLIDDLHTADLASLLLLAFLARAIGDSPVLVVTTHHDAGPPRGPEVDGVFGELGRFGRHVHLGGLDAADRRRLIAHRTGAEPPDDLVDRVAALTEGNPHRHRRSRPARAVLHSPAPRAPRAHGAPCRRGRAPHRRGREACVEPAGRSWPARSCSRCAARRGASASSRTPCASSPTACPRCRRGGARSPCSTSTTAARRRRVGSSSTSPPAASPTSRATTSGWSRCRCSPSCAKACATAIAPPRSRSCFSRSPRGTSSRPRASSAARSRATWRCAPPRAATGTRRASAWRRRARRPSACRWGRCSPCSTS